MDDPRITSIEWGLLRGKRPRAAGANSRSVAAHGDTTTAALARVTTEDGASGFGGCAPTQEQAQALVGSRLSTVFDPAVGAIGAGTQVDLALWDLAGQRAGLPVYALAAKIAGKSIPDALTAPCYDTSIYIDDLEVEDDGEAAQLIAGEAREGYDRGHRAFKVKIGRGARLMPLEQGTARDIAVIHAVRDAIGPELPLLVDANNGYNYNLARRVLAETAAAKLTWLEEPFQEDAGLFLDLKRWMQEQGFEVLLADGEGSGVSPWLMDWAHDGAVDVVQYDIFLHTFTGWLHTGRRLDEWSVAAAPHHYNSHYGNYVACHLAAAIDGLRFVEWDEAQTPGMAAAGYAVVEGRVTVPAAPGFGITLDDELFGRAVADGGYRVGV